MKLITTVALFVLFLYKGCSLPDESANKFHLSEIERQRRQDIMSRMYNDDTVKREIKIAEFERAVLQVLSDNVELGNRCAKSSDIIINGYHYIHDHNNDIQGFGNGYHSTFRIIFDQIINRLENKQYIFSNSVRSSCYRITDKGINRLQALKANLEFYVLKTLFDSAEKTRIGVSEKSLEDKIQTDISLVISKLEKARLVAEVEEIRKINPRNPRHLEITLQGLIYLQSMTAIK